MFNLKHRALEWLNFWFLTKEKRLAWQTEHFEQNQSLRQQKILAEQDLEAQLKKRSVALEHELALLRTTHHAELVMHKTKCKQNIEDYKQYLAALDDLKKSIETTYTQLPSAVAFTIHHHAKHLLNAMWDAKTDQEKMQREMQLIRFMSTVHEDARLFLEGSSNEALPEKTLKLIQS